MTSSELFVWLIIVGVIFFLALSLTAAVSVENHTYLCEAKGLHRVISYEKIEYVPGYVACVTVINNTPQYSYVLKEN